MTRSWRTRTDFRVDVTDPDASLILQKPTLRTPHEGGKRYDLGSWEHHVLLRWIQSGAAGIKPSDANFVRLEVQPSEIRFSKQGERLALRAIAHWSDGSSEDVTPLCRYQSNDEQVAKIDTHGLVTSVEPGDSHVVAFYDIGVTPIAVVRPVSDVVGPRYPNVPMPTEIDRLVVKKLRKLGIVPSELSRDSEFLRRVSLDLTGTLPAADEVVAFLADKSPDKRHKKIDELLERPTYVAWWTTRLCDLTGNNDRALANITPVNQLASQEWYDWVLKRVRENVPYDKLVEGIVLATSRPPSQTYAEYSNEMTALYRKTPEGNYADQPGLTHFWARRNIVQPQQKALTFAYTFLGTRIQCAECHKHPFDQWTQEDYKDFTKFFTRVRYGTDPSDAAERKQITESLHIDSKKVMDIRREYPRLIAEGKTLPFDEVFITPLRLRGPLRAQRPGALRARPKMAQRSGPMKSDGSKKKLADASRPQADLGRRKQSPATGTKPIVAQREGAKSADAKPRGKTELKSSETRPGTQADPRPCVPGKKAAGGQAQSATASRSGQRPVAGRRQRRFDEIRRSADAADGLAAVEKQSVFRPRVRQPRLGQLLQRGHRRSARRLGSGESAQQRRAARLPRQRIREAQLRHEVAASRDHQQPHIPVELAAQRDQPPRPEEFQPRRPPALAGGSGVRRGAASHLLG